MPGENGSKNEKKEVKLIPPRVDKRLLQPNQLLLVDAQIEKAKKLSPGFHNRKEIGASFNVMSLENNEIHAIYREDTDKVELGVGATGSTMLVENQSTAEWNVLKTVKPKKEDVEEFRKYATSEFKVLQVLNRAKSGFMESTRKNGLPKFQFLMEYVEGRELQYLIAEDQLPYDADRLRTISSHLLNGAKELYDKHYIHRDISMPNVMVDLKTDRAKIIDFGFALPHKGKPTSNGDHCGAILTLAPEILAGSTIYSEATEVYALGVLLQAIFFGQARTMTEGFFSHMAVVSMRYCFYDLESKKYCVTSRNGASSYEIDADIYHLVDRMMDIDPKKRPTIAAALDVLNKPQNEYDPQRIKRRKIS